VNDQEIGQLPPGRVLEQLRSSEEGLGQREAEARRATYGPNELTRNQQTALRVLARQFKSSLVYMLAFASLLSFLLADISDGVIIAVILLINTMLGFLQEYRSEKAVEALARFISKKVLVKRDGLTALLDEPLLVPGDVVVLKEGDVVPADCRLLAAENLQVDESQLTGESVAVAKTAQGGNGSQPAVFKDSLLYTGSVIQKGEATAVVYAIGNATELGKIASLSTGTRKVTQYEKGLQAFSSFLILVVLITLLITFVAKLVITADLSRIPELLLFIVALAIAVVPEALPVIATVTLANGAAKLARQNVVVKRLSSVEDLGNLTILCTDKTGTLTENKMTIQKLTSDDPERFQQFAYATLESYDRPGDATRGSFDAAFQAFIPEEIKQRAGAFKQVQELPFDPEARRRRVVIQDLATEACTLIVIGSALTLLDIAACPKKDEYLAEIARGGKQGLRHLALAYRAVSFADHLDILAIERDLTFLGFVALADPLRPSAQQTIQRAENLGVAIKILTGDSPEVAAYVAGKVGLGGQVYTGDELAKMSPLEFRRAANASSVFARVSPGQKYEIISALKHDHVVGYQGDGINDAPSLKLADVGIAVDTATDVAKESADIILLRPDLQVIIDGIGSGRTIFANINKYIAYTMVGNFGNFLALAILYLLSLDLPLLPVQLLLTSLITDVPLITISSDTVDPDEVVRPAKYDIRSLIFISLVLGTLTTLFVMLFFALIRAYQPLAFQTNMFLFLTFLQLVVIVSIRNHEHFWKGTRPSLLLSGAMFAALLVSLALPYIPPLASLFSFTALPPVALGIILALSVIYIFVLDTVKVWYYRVVPHA
jgi:Mg2+-importing ATPase